MRRGKGGSEGGRGGREGGRGRKKMLKGSCE